MYDHNYDVGVCQSELTGVANAEFSRCRVILDRFDRHNVLGAELFGFLFYAFFFEVTNLRKINY